MLIMRQYREEESKEIENLLIEEKIRDLQLEDLIYVLLDDDVIIGSCKVKVENKRGDLRYIVIKDDKRGGNLGDGLLRATLNKLDKDGVTMIYFDVKNPYLLKKGFEENKEGKLQLNIPEFFQKGCNCLGELNEI